MTGLQGPLVSRGRLYGKAFSLALLLALPLAVSALDQGPGGERLYNGIQLPSAWPPQPATFPVYNPTPPYLLNPPSVIPIDVGRQLFVDDFLIESTTMQRTFHQPVPHPSNPVVFPDRPWEEAYALAFSDGVFYDPSDHLVQDVVHGRLTEGAIFRYGLGGLARWHHVEQARL